ncbi:MAG: pilin [Candidatus Magasanikbacteria bacterium]|nr:pilin [Candidatus Magasanikbacteria bacterium]
MLQWINKPGKNLKKSATIGGLVLVAVFCLYFAFGRVHEVQAGALSQADPNAELLQGVASIQEPLGLPSTDIRQIAANIIRIALGFVGIVLIVLIMYGGFLWMTAGGNEEQIGKAKKILVNAIIGLIIILSAYAIVLFIMRMLGIGMGGGGTGVLAAPNTQNFRGSGALGRVIKDHYPNRNQTGVPRNTKIVVTFFKPINVSNMASDTNNSGVIGDCLTGGTFNWETSCDKLILSNDLINIQEIIPATTTTGTPTYRQIRGAAFMAASSTDATTGISGIYTFVIRPYDYLGTETEDVKYLIHLGNGIQRDDPDLAKKGVFEANAGSKYYEWTFTCSTELDLSPPYVIDVYPAPKPNKDEYKNTVIQISFNEAMDPIGIQGDFATSTAEGQYFLQNGFIYLKNNNSTRPVGSFNLVNNYQTLEFTPRTWCGVNACGGPIYCMPVCDKAGATCKRDDYELLLRAAATLSTSSFESQPFTGVADICGNALDGNKDGKIDTAPLTEPVFDNQKHADNYWWEFGLVDEMDLIPPVISQTVPGPEAPEVVGDYEWSMWFDKRMRIDPMYTIDIGESPTPDERCACFTQTSSGVCMALPDNQCISDLLWKAPFVTFATDTPPFTKTNMRHGPFLDGRLQYYLPLVSSAVEDAHFNCLFPGQGPVKVPYVTDKASSFCDPANPLTCCINSSDKTFCCNGDDMTNNDNNNDVTRSECKNNLKFPD